MEAFVTRFYQLCLEREPDPSGLTGWTIDLLDKSKSGTDIARGFIQSLEFTQRRVSNDAFLAILYKAFFNRDPDQNGWDVWIGELNQGKDRIEVLDGFLYSQEFSELCLAYGINPN